MHDSQGGSLMRLMGFLASDSEGREEESSLPLLAQLLRKFLEAIEELRATWLGLEVGRRLAFSCDLRMFRSMCVV